MKYVTAHKIRLSPNNKQANHLLRACGSARFAYNWGLSEWKRQYAAGEKPSAYALKRKFNKIKREEFPWIMETTKCAPEQAFTNLGKAFKGFFQNVKTGKKPGYPRYKKRGLHASFYLANDKFKLDGKRIRIPKLGWVNMREELRFDGRILSATVSQTAGMWFVSISVEIEAEDQVPSGPVIGIDVGIKESAVVSDGRVFPNVRSLKKTERRLRLVQKAVSRKKKGSKNREKAKRKLSRLHYKIACRRKDSMHKLTSAITTGVSAIGIEDLHVKGMMKNRCLAKALADASMSECLRQLTYKADRKGVEVVVADRFFPSSKMCSECHEVKPLLTLGEREYVCGACGVVIDRDLNAAMNLKHMAAGLAVTACCLESSGSSLGKGETIDWAGTSHGDDLCRI